MDASFSRLSEGSIRFNLIIHGKHHCKPIASTYVRFTIENQPNLGKNTTHGSHGLYFDSQSNPEKVIVGSSKSWSHPWDSLETGWLR